MKLISLDNVSVRYDDKVVLTNVNLDINSDDFIGIVGPNGGGKTSLLKAILKLIPYSGEICYRNGISIEDGSIGYLPQQNNFDRSFPITVLEVVISGLQSRHKALWKLGRTEKEKARQVMEMASINHLAGKAIGELSGGEMQKTLLCRALISEPEVLFLDEPGNFVDNRFAKELYDILEVLSNRMAIVMVSHDVVSLTGLVKKTLYVDGTTRWAADEEIIPEHSNVETLGN